MNKYLLPLILTFFYVSTTFAQNNVGIGTSTPNEGAKLDIDIAADLIADPSKRRGILIPRVALTFPTLWSLAGTPTASMLVYNTATVPGIGNIPLFKPGYYYWNPDLFGVPAWERVISFSDAYILTWGSLGNPFTKEPVAPADYSITAINTAGLGENFAGTKDLNDFVIGTTNIERMRIKKGFAGTGGNIGIGTATPTPNYLVTINPTTTAVNSGIDITMTGATTPATGINVTTANSFVNNITATNSASAAATYYGVGGRLTSGVALASGYLGYHTGTANLAANYYAGYFQGKTAITSNNSPTSTSDLEIQNTTAGTTPVTFSMRPTVEQNVAATNLAQLNFGDSRTLNPQAQIQAIRDAAGTAASSTDVPTALAFSTVPDGSGTLTERFRINNAGAFAVNGAANTGTTGQILTSGGATAAPTWAAKTSILNSQNGLSTVTSGSSATSETPYVELGGTLYKATTITQASNAFTIANNGTANTIINLSSTGDFDVQDNGTSALFVRDDGNVGIGTTAPNSKLSVNGTIEAIDFGVAGLQNVRVGDDAFLSDMDLSHTIALISTSSPTQGTLQLGNNTTGYIHGNNGNIGLKTTTLVQDVNIGGRLFVSNGVIQSGGAAITGTSDLGLYSRTNGTWIRVVTNGGLVNFYSDDNTGTSLNVSIAANGKLEAQKGFSTERQIYFYKRSRSNNNSGVDVIGNYDFCYLGGVAFRNSDSATDEDDDYQCNVYTLDINNSAEYNEGENENFTGNFTHNTRPSWRLFSECLQDCSNSTCTAMCINFDF